MGYGLLLARASIAAIGIGTMAGAAAAEDAAQRHLELPALELPEALRALALRTGRDIIAPDNLVRGLRTPPLKGDYSAEQALGLLLKGTGLGYQQIGTSLVIAKAGGSVPPDPIGPAGPIGSDAIVVTGTHVRGAAPTSPLIEITRRDIEEAAPASVEELMRRLPQNLAGGVAQENFGVTGAGADITEHGAGINLRGLGQRASLVLVDGRRLAPSSTGSFIDVSLIPVTAIERVEILTDGASAIYGSDAVAGVVNFILRTDLRGIEAVTQAGTSTKSGGRQFLAGVSAGAGWRGGRAILSGEYRAEGEIEAGQRSFTINLPAQWSLFPKERRLSLHGAARQQLTGRVSLDLSGLYAARNTDRSYFVAGPLIPVDAHAEARSLGGTAALGADLGHSWRGEAAASYFRSRTREQQVQPAGTGLQNRFDTFNSVLELGFKADGDVIELPAGPVKLALGAQTRREHYSSLFETQVNPPNPQSGERNVRSLFGELNLPLFGSANRIPGLEQLVVTAAGRFEHYQGLGSSFDPKLGILWSPFPGLKFRSSYGTSFRAPLLSETLGLYNVFLFPASLLYIDPSQAPAGVGAAVIGSNPNVRPETSTSFSAGGEWSPPQLHGLNLRATYYAIRFSNRITLPTQQIVVVGNPALDPIVTRNPGLDIVSDIFAGAGQVLDFSGPGFTPGGAGPEDVVVMVDARVANTAETRTSGLDLGLDYRFELGANRFRLELNANKVFSFDERLTAASPVIHSLNTPFHPVDLRARAGASWSRGAVSAVLFLNHSDSYRDNRRAIERRVRSFTTLDAGLAYSPSAGSALWLRNLRLALNVQNLLATDPPHLQPDPGSTRGVGYDPVNATGRGRTVSIQLRKGW
jgi:outer membrane receptor protein involved in Fe transport